MPEDDDKNLKLRVTLYELAASDLFRDRRTTGTGWEWCAAPPQRQWMDATHDRFAYRCLPLTIANQTGWWVRNPVGFTAIWRGGLQPGSIQFTFDTEDDIWSAWINDQFGQGIITWNTPLLFRTSPAESRLLVSGPSNVFKDGAQGLTAIVETDWSNASFTMNWKLTRVGLPVHFAVGEPIMQVIPLMMNPCRDFEAAEVTYMKLADAPEVAAAYAKWSSERTNFHRDKAGGKVDPGAWQKDYFKGLSSGGAIAGPSSAASTTGRVMGHTTKVTPPTIHYKKR